MKGLMARRREDSSGRGLERMEEWPGEWAWPGKEVRRGE